MDPSLAAVRTEDQPVDPRLLEQLDFVALVHEPGLRATQFIRSIQQADHVVADDSALVTVQWTDEPVIEGQARDDFPSRTGSALRASSRDGRRQRGIASSPSSGEPGAGDPEGRVIGAVARSATR